MKFDPFICLAFLFYASVTISAQNLLQDYAEALPKGNTYSLMSYYDDAERTPETEIKLLKSIVSELGLKTLSYKDYFLVGKYEINNLLVVFISETSDHENETYALLLDQHYNVIDKLTSSYTNDEGFYGVASSFSYNILSNYIHDIYATKEHTNKNYTITTKGFKPIQDVVVVNTLSGIKLREKASLRSTVLKKLANSTELEYVDHDGMVLDSVLDNGRYIKGYWLQVATKDSIPTYGYLFNGFTKRYQQIETSHHSIKVSSITKSAFQKAEQLASKPEKEEKITDIKKVKSLLGKQFQIKYNEEYDYYDIVKITADNGRVIESNEDSYFHFEECGIYGYYPKYRILVLECGHSSEYAIDLKTGNDNIDIIGNPEEYLVSLHGNYRLNGYYTGQSMQYFLEYNSENGVEYLVDLSNLLSMDSISKCFWSNKDELYFKIEETYFKLSLRRKKHF